MYNYTSLILGSYSFIAVQVSLRLCLVLTRAHFLPAAQITCATCTTRPVSTNYQVCVSLETYYLKDTFIVGTKFSEISDLPNFR